MANIAAVTAHGEEYQNLQDLIQTVKPDFSFVADTIYTIQLFEGAKVCVKDDKPEKAEGFAYPYPFSYKHEAGGNIWVIGGKDMPQASSIINVSD